MGDRATGPVPPERLQRLEERFLFFADKECKGESPLYERLSRGVAGDPDLLALAAHAPEGQPASNLLLAAVHRLLLGGDTHPLGKLYPSVAGAGAVAGDPFPAFEDFCRIHRDAIALILETRRVQTNDVRRSGVLLPAFETIARRHPGKPLALVEVGAAAGLNLLGDRYGFDFGRGKRCGDALNPVQINGSARGLHFPPVPRRFPALGFRIGIDIAPVRLDDPDGVLWLQACIWPDTLKRMTLLRKAIEMAKVAPPEVRAGDAVDVLPGIVAEIPPDQVPVIFHTFAIHQGSKEWHARFAALLDELGRTRDLYRVSFEWMGTPGPELEMDTYTGGQKRHTLLATADAHGEWIEWKG